MHTQKCDKMTSVSHTTRHNELRDQVARVAQAFGIATHKEPMCYMHHYDNGHERPDILFHTIPPCAVDIKVTTSVRGLKAAEDEKRKQHTKAVSALKHTFFPMVFTPMGGMGGAVQKVIRALTKAVHPANKKALEFELRRTMACTLAKMRAEAWKNFATLHLVQ